MVGAGRIFVFALGAQEMGEFLSLQFFSQTLLLLLTAMSDSATTTSEAALDDEQPIFFAKHKKRATKEKGSAATASAADAPTGPYVYAYIDLLERAHAQLAIANPDFATKKRFKLPPPQVAFEGAKKTLWSNFDTTCQMLHRSPEHVMSFFWAELGTDGALDGAQQLVIKGRYKPKQIETLLRRYLAAYVRGNTR
jgi:hypothetical protein